MLMMFYSIHCLFFLVLSIFLYASGNMREASVQYCHYMGVEATEEEINKNIVFSFMGLTFCGLVVILLALIQSKKF